MLPPVLDRVRGLIDPAMLDALDTLSPEIRPLAGYHLGFLDARGRPTAGRTGKAVRPALALLSTEAVGGAPQDAVRGAVAVELVHDFSLLHDDVMDEDVERRHRPTAWTVFGVGPAVLAGDALVTLAWQQLIADPTTRRVRAAGLLTDATAALIRGQGEDLAFETRDDVTVEACLRMSAGKTGALLAAACSIGAVLGGATDGVVDRFDAFGRHLGLAFQAVDDLLGIWGHPERTGKPVHSDLRQRKKSLPVVAALEAGGVGGDRLRELLARPDLGGREAEEAADLVEANGGRSFTTAEARRQLETALAQLEDLALAPAPRHELVSLARFVVERDL